MSIIERHPASYRDPDSTVFRFGDRILRALSVGAAARYAAVRETGLLDELENEGLVVASRDAALPADGPALHGYARIIEHEPLPFVSHPYEWPFNLLRRAALLHLEIQLRALQRGVSLSDASAYNVQFRGAKPVFIDAGSFRPYVEGELWASHRQFCEHFLNPLLLASDCGVQYNAWLRGSLEGVSTAALARLLPASRRLSIRHLLHVFMPARAEAHAASDEKRAVDRIRRARLPVEGYRMMLGQLRDWIRTLSPRRLTSSTWADYSKTCTYRSEELEAKRRLVREFAGWCRPEMLWDLGCNDGQFSQAALESGATRVVGFDADAGALERACERALQEGLDFLPLYQDAADPSPGLGWRGRERASLAERARADAVMALAFEHHLAVGRNVPLPEVVDFLVSLAPRGMVEFVPKTDPTVQRMLALKGDIFPDYAEERFRQALMARARIARCERVSESGRTLYWFER